ncbi:hypothetical protein B9Z65_2219 [Elsinoe australis]|uniref:Uncharacterized protein n=1 Tax=Elsinoe australis TaxID=40998 RepID=A0A2P7YND0_9PEZI|nr:hypothetical protein B9Z65_2219 [Elsinoe australis]
MALLHCFSNIEELICRSDTDPKRPPPKGVSARQRAVFDIWDSPEEGSEGSDTTAAEDDPRQHDAITKSQLARLRTHQVTQEQHDPLNTFSNVELGEYYPHLPASSTGPGPFRPLHHGLRDRKGEEETIIVDDEDSVPSRKEKGKGKAIVAEDEDSVNAPKGKGKGKGKAIIVHDEDFVPTHKDKRATPSKNEMILCGRASCWAATAGDSNEERAQEEEEGKGRRETATRN